MAAIALLVLREVLEAALIVSIVLAATRGVPRRGWFVAGGIALGLAGAGLVAGAADMIAGLANGAGQDVLEAGVLLAATAMIGWHVVWMSAHARELTRRMQSFGGAVRTGASSLAALLGVVALAVLREGSEVVLFVYGIAAGGIGTAELTAGIALGIVGGSALAVVLYFGLLRIPLAQFFRTTNVLLILLAAGLAATAAGFLEQGGLVGAWGSRIWDSSALIPDGSIAGRVLGVLVGYNAHPDGIQLAFYLAVLAALSLGAGLGAFVARRNAGRGLAAAATLATTCALGIATARPAVADDFTVYPPYVSASQAEIEWRGYRATDARRDERGAAAEVSVAYGVTAWWKPEIYVAKYVDSPQSGRRLIGYELENTFQLTPQGKYPVDLGLLASYERNTAAGIADAVEFGPLLAATRGRFTHVVNLIWEKEVGRHASRGYEFRYDYAGTYALSSLLRPGLEAYGRPADHAYQAGPIVAGEWRLPRSFNGIEYRAGVLVGLNASAPRQTWLLRMEYEFL